MHTVKLVIQAYVRTGDLEPRLAVYRERDPDCVRSFMVCAVINI